MNWKAEIERKAQKALKKIPGPYKTNIIETIDELASDPRPHGCTKLKGVTELWRVRVGTYRIVYQIRDEQLLAHHPYRPPERCIRRPLIPFRAHLTLITIHYQGSKKTGVAAEILVPFLYQLPNYR